MTEIPIIWKIFIAFIFLLMFAVSAFLGSRVLALLKRVQLLQADRNELLEERVKQSNKLRLKGIEMDEEKKKEQCSDIMFRTIKKGETVIGELLSELEQKMILSALNMSEYENMMKDPPTSFQVRKVYRNLKERIKDSLA